MSAPVMSKAGRYGVSWAAVPTGAWVMTTGWLGSAARSVRYARTSPATGTGAGRLGVRGLVDALPGAECRMVLELPDDVREQSAVWRERARREVGHVAELQPAVETVLRSRIEHLARRRDLLVDRLEAPVGPAHADEARAAGCDLGERVFPIRRLPRPAAARSRARAGKTLRPSTSSAPVARSTRQRSSVALCPMSASFAPMANEEMQIGRRTVRVTHPERVLFPRDGVTKGDLASTTPRSGT